LRFGIAFKINLVVFATVLLLGGALGAFFVDQQDRALRTALDRRIHLLGGQLSVYLGHELVEREPGEIEGILQSVSDPEIAYLLVKSVDGEVVAGRWTAEVHSGVTEFEFPLYGDDESYGRPAPESFGVIEAAPGSVPVGSLAIGVDLSLLRATRRTVLQRVVVGVVGAGVVAALLGALLVQLTLQRAIEPLLAGIRGVAGGDLARRVPLEARRDEIGDIGRAFNEMTDRLAATLVSKGELEAMVERRTSELSEALRARERAQATAAERESQVRMLLESTAESIYGIGTDGLCTFCNPACVRALGYQRPEELVGRNMHDLIHHSSAEGVHVNEADCRIYRTLRDHRGYHADDELLYRADGTHFPVELWSYPMFRGEAFAGAVVTFIDLTERKRLEGEVLKVRKLESLGVLAGGIAHDFNNLLMGILGNLSLAREELANPAEAAELLHEAEQATLRARKLTQQLLTFSRGGAPVRKVIALRPVVEEAASFALSGATARGEQTFAQDLWAVQADAGQIGQVIHNLVINAVQAMTQGGVIRISCDNVSLADGEVVPLPAGRYVRLAVQDTGPGIAPEHLPRVFDPYFTTKAGGHGLGLASVYSIARKHGGHVTVASAPGAGTTFEVYLPAASGEISGARPPAAVVPAAPRGTRILVMDDEAAVRRVGASMLERLGYDVESAADGAAAIEAARAARERGRPFDLMLLDLTVPGGMGGVEALKQIRAFEPGAVFIATSGYSNDPVMSDFRAYGFAAAVAKPYSLDDLGQALASANGARAAAPA
jgi:PAS domain S-box-containing protein